MNYNSKPWIDSKAIEGVRFQILKINKRRRDKFNEAMSAYNTALRALRAERAPLDAEYRAAIEAAKAKRATLVAGGATVEEAAEQAPVDFSGENFEKWCELADRERTLDNKELGPALLRFGFLAIDGLDIDGEPATVDSIIADGPDDLYVEISEAIAREFRLMPEEKENLPLPATLPTVVDGPLNNGTVATAVNVETTTTVIAGSSTQIN